MKKIIVILFVTSFSSLFAQVEYSMPNVARKIDFMDVMVNLDEDAHKRVNDAVLSLLTPQNSYLDTKLELMQWYFPIVEQILEKENVPDDLKYLMVQESDLKPDALSSSSAVGFWQFKEATGKEYGLRIDNDIDERKYILASTKAAASYFKKNNIIFKNWVSCIYAFNQGPTGASKEIPDSWSYAKEIDFNQETPDYLIEALAHRVAFEHRLNRLKKSPRMFAQYPTRSKSLAEIAVELTVDLSELRKYNVWLYAASIPPAKEYTILIPVRLEDMKGVMEKINKRRELVITDKGYPKLTRKTNITTSEDEAILYEINGKNGLLAQPGDEAAQMAKKGGISLPNFLKYNDMSDRDMIKTGQIYYLEIKSKKGPISHHTASHQQTFWDVSQNYGIQISRLLKYNRLKEIENLQPGRVVWLQKKRPKNQPVEIIQEVIPRAVPAIAVQTYEEPKSEDLKELKLDEPIAITTIDSALVIEETTIDSVNVEEEANENILVESAAAIPIITEDIEEESKVDSKSMYHTVAKGETLYAITRLYDISLSELLNLNNIKQSDVLEVGQKLIVGSQIENQNIEIVSEDIPVSTSQNLENQTHTVSKGQTLYAISRMYGISVQDIQKWNNLRNASIEIGQELIVGESNTPPTQDSDSKTHQVQKGETLYSISQNYGISVNQLKSWNQLKNNSISIGQKLKVSP